jgi:hypothetical protein
LSGAGRHHPVVGSRPTTAGLDDKRRIDLTRLAPASSIARISALDTPHPTTMRRPSPQLRFASPAPAPPGRAAAAQAARRRHIAIVYRKCRVGGDHAINPPTRAEASSIIAVRSGASFTRRAAGAGSLNLPLCQQLLKGPAAAGAGRGWATGRAEIVGQRRKNRQARGNSAAPQGCLPSPG